VDVPDKLKKISLIITQYGFVAILEQIACTIVSQIKVNGIACEQASHQLR